jgi:uncharacterized protein (DUF1501 family)
VPRPSPSGSISKRRSRRAAGSVAGRGGTIPRLDDLDATHNLKVNTDFRRVYAAIIDDWLGGDHTALLPGAPFAPLPVIL